METLIHLYDKIGLQNYTIIIFIFGFITVYFFNLVDKLTDYFYFKSTYYFEKRKELKKWQ